MTGQTIARIVRPRPDVPTPTFSGSLVRLEDLDFECWIFDHRREAQFRQTARGKIETAIERLVALLDHIDGDAEAEPIDEREPDHEGEEWEQPVSLQGACP